MTSSYPGGLDSLTNPSSSDSLNSPSHADQHAGANDAIEAIEATLGTDPQGSEATVKARIAALEGGGGATPTIAGQTLAYFQGDTTVNVSIPGAAAAGDLFVAFLPTNNSPNIPSGWVALVSVTGQSYINHALVTKVATSADITAGSFTFTTAGGSDDGEVILVAVHGWVRVTGFADNRNQDTTTLSTNPFSPYSMGMGVGDLALYMVGSRSDADTMTFDKGTVVARRASDANSSSALYAGTHTDGGPIFATATSSGSSMAVCVVTIAG